MVKKVTKKLNLRKYLSEIPKEFKQDAKKEVGNHLVKRIGEYLDQQKSPVTGGQFTPLKKKYRDFKKKQGKGGDADLFFDGDMQSQIMYREYRDGIEIGIFDEGEAQKADNHNKNSAKSKKTKVPQRQFIPHEGKGRRASFHTELRAEVEKILNVYAGKGDDGNQG